MNKIRSVALIVGCGILSLYLLHNSTFDRFILQMAIQGVVILLVINVLFKAHAGAPRLSKPFGSVVGFSITSIFSLFLFGILHLIVESSYNENYLTFQLLLSSLIISICASAFEELVFRAPLLIAKNQKPQKDRFSFILIVLQAIIFGLVHYSKYRPIVFVISAFGVGLLLGILAVQLRSLWFVIGLHAGIDFIAYAVNGLRVRKYLDYPGILSFDDAGISIKTATSLFFPVFGLLIYFWRKRIFISMHTVSS